MTSTILQIIFNGLGVSAQYLFFAVGLSLIFGVMKTVNFAHGELYILGGYISWLMFSLLGNYMHPMAVLLISILVAVGLVGGVGVMIDRLLFMKVKGNPLNVLIVSYALAHILQSVLFLIFGDLPKGIRPVASGMIIVSGSYLAVEKAMFIAISIGLVVLLWFFLERTNIGRGLRACSQDREAGLLQGISFKRASSTAMFVGCALAGIGGAIIGSRLMVTPWAGESVVWKAFVVIIVGGMGSVGGSVLAAVLFGFLDTIIQTLLNPELTNVIDVLTMLIVLAWRPQGLMGREGRGSV